MPTCDRTLWAVGAGGDLGLFQAEALWAQDGFWRVPNDCGYPRVLCHAELFLLDTDFADLEPDLIQIEPKYFAVILLLEFARQRVKKSQSKSV
jgi:hypothetical protein